MNTLPILFKSHPDAPIFWYKGEVIKHEQFKRDVTHVAANLSLHDYAINLCEDRYLFAVAFVACMLQKQICLLPASHTENEIKALENDYADTFRIEDEVIETLLANKDPSSEETRFPDQINADQLVALVFTSGSTGKPKANPKSWGALVDSAQRVASQLNFNKTTQHTLVATVPPQHMYGFETTIIFPLVANVCVHNSKPFFPEDIRHTLEKVQSPVILVTTPIHLRACNNAELDWPAVDFVLSATAPLSTQLALDIEKRLKTTVREIYGCSEAGVIATRETTKNPDWTLLPEYKFNERFDGYCLITPLSNEEIILPDKIEQLDNQQFRLLGRQSDLIKIAGKRGSLNDLKLKLCSLDGVEDAIFFMPYDKPDEKARLAAFVVAPQLSIKEITAFFSQQVDHAFMPRPLIKIENLPYNETGKLPRKNLLDLFTHCRHRKPFKDSA